jgi:Holliday junction resolvase RusA-like endonuclease
MTVTRIVVYGLPAPQGSKRHVGNGVMVESSKYVKPWREAVKAAAIDVITIHNLAGHSRLLAGYPLDGPLQLCVVFTFSRPSSHYRTGANNWMLRPNAPTAPASKPDLSKLIRSTEDALTDAGVWRDDSRVVQITAAKVYAGSAHPDALDRPGAVIEIWPAFEGPKQEGTQ